jgi:peptide/nickel transport system permease protein
VTVIGLAFTTIFGGSVIAETVLSIDGLGVFLFRSVLARDFPVIQFLVLYTAAVVVTVNLVVDLSYAWIDPRIRYR